MLTQAFVGHGRVVTSLDQECDIVTQSCPLHLTIETMWGPVRFTMPFIVLPGGTDVLVIGQKTLRETSDRCHDPAQGVGAEGTQA